MEGKRNEYHIVKQKDYMIYEGEHEAIVPEEMWLKANDKLNSNGKQHQFKKLYSLEHQHVLSGILKCPICGSGMYGTVNRKKKKDGSYYKDAFYYVCKHRKLVDGHHCTYNRQPSQKSIDDEVYAILADAVHNPRFAEFVSQTINKKTDDGALKEKLRELKKSRKQFVLKKEKLERQIDNLDVLDEYYDEKYDDLTRRHDRFYREIADVDSQIIETEAEIDAAYSAELTMKNALQEISGIKDRWYDFTDADRKNICNHFIDSVEIFPEKLENGRRVKAIHFAMPMLINDKETTDWWYSEAHRETVCLLSKLSGAKNHISVKVDMDEMDVTAAESKATYDEIREWVQENYGMHVTNLNIAQVKRKHGIIERENYNKPKSLDSKQPGCPEEKVKAIEAALRFFQMIYEVQESYSVRENIHKNNKECDHPTSAT